VEFSTQWQWITFAKGGDSGTIQAKTSNPSNIYLDVAIMYRIREENLHDIYKKWPTKNIQRDFILFAKVTPTSSPSIPSDSHVRVCRTRYRRSLRTTRTTTSSPSGRRFSVS
jgi:hypothetical protein